MNQWQSGLAPHLSWQAPAVGVLRSLLTMLFSLSSQVPIWRESLITCYGRLCLLTSKSSQPDGPAAVVVVAGACVDVVVVSGLGPGGQGQLERSGWVGPLVQPEQLQHSHEPPSGQCSVRVNTHISDPPHWLRR